MFLIHTPNDELKSVLSELYAKYGYDMKRMAYGICKSSAISDDAVQQTFERLIKYPEAILRCEAKNRRLLLFTICKHEVYRIYSHEKRENEKIQKLTEKISLSQDEYDDLLHQYIHNESITTVKEKVTALPPEYSLPLILRECSELKLSKIAKIMSLSISGVRKRIIKGRGLIARSMREEDESDEKRTLKNK